jgi:hypothetical protein
VQASDFEQAVRAFAACAISHEHRGKCLQFFASYRLLAVPFVDGICDKASATLSPPHRIRVLLALAEPACLFPQILPIIKRFATTLPPLIEWLQLEDSMATEHEAVSCGLWGGVAAVGRAVLLLLVADLSFADIWTRQAVLQLLLHPSSGVRWTGVQATSLLFGFSNPETDSIKNHILSADEVLQCTCNWERHYGLIEVRYNATCMCFLVAQSCSRKSIRLDVSVRWCGQQFNAWHVLFTVHT